MYGKAARPEVQYGERQPLVTPQVFAPEAQRTLAGGGAQRNHRSWTKTILRPGRDAGLVCAAELSWSGALPGRGSRCGASGGYAALHHRL